MCLAVPGQIVEIREEMGTRMATVDFDGIQKDICLAFLPDIDVGDYTIVHVGFAISEIDEVSALESLAVFAELGILEEELGPAEGERAEGERAEGERAEGERAEGGRAERERADGEPAEGGPAT